MGFRVSLAALFTWIVTAGAGLYLLTIWLIEYDRDFQSAAATRLPVPVISALPCWPWPGWWSGRCT